MVDEFLQAIPGVLTHRAKKSGVIQLPTHQPILEESNFDANSMVIVWGGWFARLSKMPCQIVSGQIIIATENNTSFFHSNMYMDIPMTFEDFPGWWNILFHLRPETAWVGVIFHDPCKEPPKKLKTPSSWKESNGFLNGSVHRSNSEILGSISSWMNSYDLIFACFFFQK